MRCIKIKLFVLVFSSTKWECSLFSFLFYFMFVSSFYVVSWFQKKSNYGQGRRRMNSRTSMAQREEVIRRTVYVCDIDQQVKTCTCLLVIILFTFLVIMFDGFSLFLLVH